MENATISSSSDFLTSPDVASFFANSDNASANTAHAIVSDEIRYWIESLLNVLIFIFGTLGVVTNAINIRIFVQQDVTSDSSTIGLLSLAVSDLLGCLTLLPSPICEALKHARSRTDSLVYSCHSWFLLAFPVPHIAMSRLTCWITVYIAVERSICVLLPFKAKLWIRPKVTASAMLFLFMASVLLYLPLYVNTGLSWVEASQGSSNATFWYFAYTETAAAKVIRNYMSLILNTVMSTVAGVVVAIATGLMLYKLREYRKWREKTSTASRKTVGEYKEGNDTQPKTVDSVQGRKDVEMLKMVAMVTGLFLVCLSMSHLPGLASAFVPEFSVTGVNGNLFYLLYWYKFVFDLINSSLNFFFYIRISSRYIAAFDEVFNRRKR